MGSSLPGVGVVSVMALATVLASSPPWGQAMPSRAAVMAQHDAARQLEKLENDWAQAVVRRDAKALAEFVAPRWVYSDESGVMDRAAGIKAFTSGTDTVRQATNRDMHAIIYPGTAVMTGILEMRGRGPSGPFVHRYRYTDTWLLIGSRWLCIASQDYLMPERRAAH